MSQNLIIEALQKQLLAKDAIIAKKDAACNSLQEKNKELQHKVDELTHQLNRVYRVINSAKSESFKQLGHLSDANQGSLFDDQTIEQLENDGEKLQEKIKAALEDARKNQTPLVRPDKVKKEAHKPSGPQKFPDHLERRIKILQPNCNLKNAICLGYDIRETIHIDLGKIWVEQIQIPRYLVKNTNTDETSFVQAAAPKSPLDRLTAGPSILASLIVDKFVYHLPIYRQIKKFEQYGYSVPAGTICGWLDKAQRILAPLYDSLKSEILKTNSLQADETPIDVSGIKKGKLHQGYMWVYRDVVSRLVLFDFQLGSGAEYPKAFLKNYVGHLQVDGYIAYETKGIGGKECIILTYCHVHTRRKFVDCLQFDSKLAVYYIAEIAKIYKVESEIKEKGLTGQQKVAYREQNAGPVLDALGDWLVQQKKEVTPSTPIAKAIDYALQRWEGLKTYLHHDFLEPDTNLLEQQIRVNTLGRKNWLFAGSKHGGNRIAMMYSLLACCKEYKIDHNVYFEDILGRIDPDNTKMSDIKELLPHRWKPLSTTITVDAFKVPSSDPKAV